MIIRFLGTSHGFCEKGRFCSSAAITSGDRSYIIDAGAPIACLLKTYGIEYTSIGGIFITHSHSDHYMGLVEYINQLEGFREYKGFHNDIYVPEGFPKARINQFLFGDPEGKKRTIPGGDSRQGGDPEPDRVTFITYLDGSVFDDGRVSIEAIPVQHMDNAHSFLVREGDKKVLFSGDLARNFPDYPAVLTDEQGGGVDLLIIEGAHTRLNKPEIIDLFSRTKTKKLIITHCNYAVNTREIISEVRTKLSGLFPVEEAFDGLQIKL